MTGTDANEIIAKFMEIPFDMNLPDSPSIPPECLMFDKSLDSLVPVWKKMAVKGYPDGIIIYSCILEDQPELFNLSSNLIKQAGGFDVDSEEKETIQEAAAIATAIAIKECM